MAMTRRSSNVENFMHQVSFLSGLFTVIKYENYYLIMVTYNANNVCEVANVGKENLKP